MITEETRFESWLTCGKHARHRKILDLLKDEDLTASEIAEKINVNTCDVRPRLTELKEHGAIFPIGKRESKETGKKIAVWHRVI